MKIYHGLLIILFLTVHQANAGFFSFISGWFYSAPPGEECTVEWIPNDIRSLEMNLHSRLYGQHMVIDHVPSMIRHHWNKEDNLNKPLVLSLHGSTGVGKNYVSKIIVQSLFKLGDKSKFVTMYSGRLDFPEASRVQQYQEQLKNDLVRKVKACDRHVFIFDEVDKVPKGVLDILKPFLDYTMKVRDVDFRKSIFIFLSNLGQTAINTKHYSLWQKGIPRTDLEYSQFEKVLRDGVYNEEGGLKESANIAYHLIDFYIPFLALEAKHVKQCIQYEFQHGHYITATDEEIGAVHNYVEYGPEDNPIFAKTGCKSISSKVALIASLRRSRGYSDKEL